MKKIGNIICHRQIDANHRFNVITDMTECIPDIPTLVVGFKLSCELFGESNINFHNRKINDYLFWTFAKNENRRDFEIDIELFIQHCYNQLIKNVQYFFIDRIHWTENQLLRANNKIKNSKSLIGYIHNNRMIYLHCDDLLFGIDLELSKFLSVDPEKIKSKLDQDTGGLIEFKDLLPEYHEDIERLEGAIKYIPYLLHLDKE